MAELRSRSSSVEAAAQVQTRIRELSANRRLKSNQEAELSDLKEKLNKFKEDKPNVSEYLKLESRANSVDVVDQAMKREIARGLKKSPKPTYTSAELDEFKYIHENDLSSLSGEQRKFLEDVLKTSPDDSDLNRIMQDFYDIGQIDGDEDMELVLRLQTELDSLTPAQRQFYKDAAKEIRYNSGSRAYINASDEVDDAKSEYEKAQKSGSQSAQDLARKNLEKAQKDLDETEEDLWNHSDIHPGLRRRVDSEFVQGKPVSMAKKWQQEIKEATSPEQAKQFKEFSEARKEGKPIDKEAYKELMEDVKNELPPEARAWFKAKDEAKRLVRNAKKIPINKTSSLTDASKTGELDSTGSGTIPVDETTKVGQNLSDGTSEHSGTSSETPKTNTTIASTDKKMLEKTELENKDTQLLDTSIDDDSIDSELETMVEILEI